MEIVDIKKLDLKFYELFSHYFHSHAKSFHNENFPEFYIHIMQNGLCMSLKVLMTRSLMRQNLMHVRNLLGPLANLLIRLANYSNSLRILIKKQLRSLLLVNLDLAQSFQAFMNYDLCIPFLIMIFLHIYSIVQSSVVIHTREQE